MRLIDLEALRFINLGSSKVQSIAVNSSINVMDSNYNEVATTVEQLIDSAMSTINKDYVEFRFVFDCGEMDRDSTRTFVQLVSALLLSKITTKTLRDRESRLNIPKQLDKISLLSRVAYLNAINYKTLVQGFGGFIEVNGNKYYILGNQ